MRSQWEILIPIEKLLNFKNDRLIERYRNLDFEILKSLPLITLWTTMSCSVTDQVYPLLTISLEKCQ